MDFSAFSDLVKSSSILIEDKRPDHLVPVDADHELVSNSRNTQALIVLRDAKDPRSEPCFIEKTVEIAIWGKGNTDIYEVLFYLYLRDEVCQVPGVHCAKAVAIRWEAADRITLRLTFLKGTKLAVSESERLSAVRAAGGIARQMMEKKTDRLPDWLVRSPGIGTAIPESSLRSTARLFKLIGLEKNPDLFRSFYENGDHIRKLYRAAPFSLSHGDANHQNIRAFEDTEGTVFLDWPRVKIASVADDAARLVQPWILFFSEREGIDGLRKTEALLYGAFIESLGLSDRLQMNAIRDSYEIRSIVAALAVSEHLAMWVTGATSQQVRQERIQKIRDWYTLIYHRTERFAGMSNDRIETLKDRYYGSGASEYNKQRQNDERWQREHRGTEAFVKRHAGKSVLDLPVGTGRFLGLYKEYDMKTIGLDRSTDMLKESQKEADALGYKNIFLFEADATNFEGSKFKADVVICTRFLNWLPFDLARKAFLNLAEACKEEMLITLTSIDPRKFEGADRERVEKRLAASHDPKPDSHLPPNGPHSFTGFLDWLETAGMEIVDKTLLVEGKNNLLVELITLRKK